MNPFGVIYSFQFVFMLACAAFYYRAAEIEDAPRLVWLGMSMGVYLLTWVWLGWGLVGNLLGQAALLIAIAAVRLLREQLSR
jgi:hypothetical protein